MGYVIWLAMLKNAHLTSMLALIPLFCRYKQAIHKETRTVLQYLQIVPAQIPLQTQLLLVILFLPLIPLFLRTPPLQTQPTPQVLLYPLTRHLQIQPQLGNAALAVLSLSSPLPLVNLLAMSRVVSIRTGHVPALVGVYLYC